MMWLPVITCFAVLSIAVIAWHALRIGRRALHKNAVLETLLTKTSQRMLEMETELNALRGQTSALFGRVDRVCLRQRRIETVAGKAGFNEAIAFARHGANERELIDTCGLSHGEARLVQVLYGTDIECDSLASQHDTSETETH